MRARTVVIQAGGVTVPMTSETLAFARVASDPVPAWRSENASVNESDPSFSRVLLTARSLAVMMKVSRELLEDSANLEQMLPRIIAGAMAVEVDRVALIGSGVAPEPTGVYNQAGIGWVYHNDTLDNFDPFVTARRTVKNANTDVTAWITSPTIEARLALLKDGNGQPLQAPTYVFDGGRIPMLATTGIPVTLNDATDATANDDSIVLGGDWSRLMLGMRSELRIEVLRERYADTLQYGLVAHLRMDCAVEDPDAFVAIGGISAT